MTSNLPASHLVDVFEHFLEAPITRANDKVASLPDDVGLELASLIDQSLDSYRLEVTPLLGSHAVLPIVYDHASSYDWIEKPKTCSRLTLLHPYVVAPVANVEARMRLNRREARLHGKQVDLTPLAALSAWTSEHSTLLRKGAILPLAHDVYYSRAVDQLCLNTALSADVTRLVGRHADFAPVFDEMTAKESEDVARMSIYYLVSQLFLSRKLRLTPALSHPFVANLWQAILNQEMASEWTKNNVDRTANTLLTLSLPKLDSISQQDVCSLHDNSEAFAAWRDRVQHVLLNVTNRVDSGDELEEAFKEESFVLREAARHINDEIKSGNRWSIGKRVATQFGIGAIGTLISSAMIPQLGIGYSGLIDLLKLGPAALSALIVWLIADSGDKGKTHSLKFYSAVTEGTQDAP